MGKGYDHEWPWEELTGGVKWKHLAVLSDTIVCMRGRGGGCSS